jgi:outer membrane immunogenic protein
MRKFVVPVVAVIGLTATALAPAIAADMKVKAPVYTKAPPPVLTWTGCYVGGNGGWKGSRFSETDFAPGVTGLGATTLDGTSIPGNVNGSSAAAGGQVGCRYESPQQWVFGLEGDFDWTNVHATQSLVAGTAAGVLIPGDNFSLHERWESSLRASIGQAWGSWLVYVTGGPALARVDKDASYIATVAGGGIAFPASSGSDGRTLFGYTIGAGAAYAFDAHWDLGVEYRFSSYQSSLFSLGTVAAICNRAGACVTTPVTGSVGLQTNEVLARLNYRFPTFAP